jgi:hypothetical protein
LVRKIEHLKGKSLQFSSSGDVLIAKKSIQNDFDDLKFYDPLDYSTICQGKAVLLPKMTHNKTFPCALQCPSTELSVTFPLIGWIIEWSFVDETVFPF